MSTTLAANASIQPTIVVPKGTATTVRARSNTVLHIVAGRAWVTLTQHHFLSDSAQGDLVLSQGQTLSLSRGQSAVVEPWSTASHDSVVLRLEEVKQHGQHRTQNKAQKSPTAYGVATSLPCPNPCSPSVASV